MSRSWNPRSGRKRYERAGAVVLNQVRLGQAPVSLRRVRWTRRGLWILLALALVVAGGALWLTLDPRFYVYDAQIVGNRRLSNEAIFEASGLRTLHVLWARPATIESRVLQALPSLESVEAKCQLPSECFLSVAERQPRVLWDEESGASGGLWWIDEDGTIFPVAGSAVPTSAEAHSDSTGSGQTEAVTVSGRWQVTGPLPRDEYGKLEDRVRVALTEFWASGRDLPTTFRYTPEQGLSFIDAHGWRLILGQGSGMARRLQVLESLVAHLESRGVVPHFVDVRFPEAPYYVPVSQ